jgi:hypothetical protein
MKAVPFVAGIISLLASAAYCQSSLPAAPSRFVPKGARYGALSSPMSSQKATTGRRRSMQASQGGLSFADAVTYSTGGYEVAGLAAVDVNGDGYPDLIVANGCGLSSGCTANGTVAVLLNNGNGTFAPAVNYSSGGYQASSVAVSDVNGDGKPDIVVVNACGASSNCTTDSTVAVLLGNGDGTFGSAATYDTGGFGGQSLAIADVNGDGKPDLLVVNKCGTSSTCSTDGTVAVLPGNGDGTFQTAVNYDAGVPDSEMVAVGDVSGDGNPDLVVVNDCLLEFGTCDDAGGQIAGSVSILLGNGNGIFAPASNFYSGTPNASAVALADLNNGGYLDTVVNGGVSIGGEVAVLLGNGNGTFQNPTDYSLNAGIAGGVTAEDVNGDGKLDLEVWVPCGGNGGNCSQSSAPAGTAVLLGNGDGTFQAAQYFGSAGFAYGAGSSLAVADSDGDGRPDLVFTAGCADSGCATGSAELSIVGVLINTTTFPNSSPTTTALVSSLNPSNVGQFVTFAATVTPSGSSSTPAGTVSLNTGSTSLGVFSLSGGIATAEIATLPAGTQSITATYNGSSLFTSSTSAALSQVVRGILVSPSSLSFPTQNVGTSSPMTVTVTSTATTLVSISSIAITGANSSNFSQTNNCPGSLPAGGSCSINVTFSPNATASFLATLNISDSLPGSPQTVALAGSGVASIVLSPTSVTFPNQYVGTTGLPQTVTLTNNGGTAVTIASVSTSTSDFGSLSSCGNSVSPASSCAIGVFFDPTQGGSRSGVLAVTDNTNGALTVVLTGNGQDFSMSSPLSDATVTAGETATYVVDLSGLGGFNQTVALSCGGAPANATCSLSPDSVALKGSTPSTVNVTVTTGGSSARLTIPDFPSRPGGRLALWVSLAALPAFLLTGYGSRSRKRRFRGGFRSLGLLCLLSAVMVIPACGGGSSNNGNGSGTIPGTYILTLTGSFTSGSTNLTHTAKLTLVVR